MSSDIVFDPIAPWLLISAAGALALVMTALALWQRSPAWILRGLGFGVLILALANPALVRELRRGLSDIAIVVVDETESQTIGEREDVTSAAEAEVMSALEALAARDEEAPLETRVVRVTNDGGPVSDPGTQLLTALNKAAAEVPAERIAGAILITDGQIHDQDALTEFPAPVHGLITGQPGETDRRLVVTSAPAFGIVGEEIPFALRVEGPEGVARVTITMDGEPVASRNVTVGADNVVNVPITHGGANVAEIVLEPIEGELTLRNNRAAITVNGVRDRLRVLLVSGEPHAGERTWRNLLKADPSVDLVHFTILRPPSKQDGTPVFELSLIAFPTRELFLEKVDEFDLIVFDRYRRRGVLPSPYIANIARYVREGGAVLIASGPYFAGVESLYRTPLADILPVTPTANITEAPFTPKVTEDGARHPVTSGLSRFSGGEDDEPNWGRWLRQIDVDLIDGLAVMNGADERPLLVLNRVQDGRVAVLASDHAWLWSRGFEGGGPQAEMLRRLAHWLMKEPELEEEALIATAQGSTLTIERRSVEAQPETVEVISPSGERTEIPLEPVGPGRWLATYEAEEQGLHRLTDGILAAIAAVGPPAPIEFESAVSTTELLEPLSDATEGGVVRLADGIPDIRRVRDGRRAAGRGWIGLARREAYTVEDVRLTPLAPGWAMLLISASLMIAAWRVEGR
ncbi:MAG: glutamine amidotransferase [Pseudomonadota bacterium]